MLNQSRVLNYIKDHLGFPFMQVELSDENIISFVQEYTLREFSLYIPEVKRMNLNTTSEATQVAGRSSEFYLEEPEGLEILNVVDIILPLANYLIYGHSPLGVGSMSELKEFALSTATSMMTRQYSDENMTFEFMHPNKIRISPLDRVTTRHVTIEYERMQPPDFRGIPNDLQVVFCKFALADIMIKLGRVRKKYEGQMNTPFGSIPISSEILDEGKELKQQIEDKLRETYLPNVTFAKG